MKTRPGFNLRQLCGENIIVAEGEQNIDFSNIISMNESAAYLWQKLQPLDQFTAADMARLLREEYEVSEEQALKDCATLAATWANAQIIEGDDIPQVAVEPLTAIEPEPSLNNTTASSTAKPKRKGLLARLFGR